jgi:serine/threonine protein kinase
MKIIDVDLLHQRYLSLGYSVDMETLSEKVELEAKILAILSHPNIVQLCSAFRILNNVFICMEYVDGVNLLNYVTKDGMLESYTREIFRQLMKALYFCRKNSVIHGDVKLENILLSSQGELKLIDFGFSHFVIEGQQLEVSPFFFGSFLFMSDLQFKFFSFELSVGEERLLILLPTSSSPTDGTSGPVE